MLGIEDQNAPHLAIGDKKPVVVVDGQAVDPSEVGLIAVADELGVVGRRVEDEHGSNLLIGHVDQALGIYGDAGGADELERKSLGIEFSLLGCPPARRSIQLALGLAVAEGV